MRQDSAKFTMTQESLMIVELQIQASNGHFFVTSPNLPGLNVSAVGAEGTFQAVVRMVKALYRHNSGYEVDVWPATTDGGEFPKMMRLCSQVVVQRKAPRKVRSAPGSSEASRPRGGMEERIGM